MKATSRFLILSSALFSVPALATVVNNKTTEDGYAVVVYECDASLDEIPTAERHRKIQGSSYRLCFAPNKKALEDGIGMERIDFFNWEHTSKKGVAEQKAIIDGDGDNILSLLYCNEDHKLCYLDSMLGSPFYVDAGSVLGYGTATLTDNKGTVEVERWLFPHDFKFTMMNADGTEMNEEELRDLGEKLAAQEAAMGTASMGSEL